MCLKKRGPDGAARATPPPLVRVGKLPRDLVSGSYWVGNNLSFTDQNNTNLLYWHSYLLCMSHPDQDFEHVHGILLRLKFYLHHALYRLHLRQ